MKIISYCALMLCTLLLMPGYAEAAADLAPAHRAAVARMLMAVQAERLANLGLRTGLDKLQASHAEGESYQREFIASLKPGQIIERFVPIYSKYFTREEAESVANFFETATGSKVINGIYNEVKAGKKVTLESAYLSVLEKNALTMFLQTTPGKKFFQPNPALADDTAGMFKAWRKAWVEESSKNKMKQAFAPVIKEFDAQMADEAAGLIKPPAAPGAATTGKPTVFDQIAAVVANNSRRSQENRLRFQTDLEQLGIDALLNPQNFITQAGIDEGKRKVQQIGEALDQFLKSAEDIFQEVRQQTSAIVLPATEKEAFMKGAEKSWARVYDENIRYGENQRNLVEIYRRMYEFAQTRLGRIEVSDNRLMFTETADLEIFRSLSAQLEAESEREKALVKESQERRKQALQKFR